MATKTGVTKTGVKGVLFDFGNTLFAHAPLAVTIGRTAGVLGVQISEDDAVAMAFKIDSAAMMPEELAHLRDLDMSVWKERWEVLYGLADEWGHGLGDAIHADMHAPQEWLPYPRTLETLRSLHNHDVAIGIVSNTGWDVRTVFEAHGLDDVVTTFTLSYEAGFVKPDRRIFDAACASLALEPDEVVMVGDDPRADSGAVGAGIPTLLLPALPPQLDNGIAAVLDLVGVDE